MSGENNKGGGRLSAFMIPLACAIVLIAADQITKALIQSSFAVNESVEVIPGFFNIVFIMNKGAAFGFLSDVESEWVSWGFTAIAAAAIAVIVVLYRSLGMGERAARVSLVLIGSGAVGNLIDRIRFGEVTDFLLFYIGKYQWPAFNVADSCITVGVILLGYSLLARPAMKEDF